MYKVGQRVRVTAVVSNPWWNFIPEDRDRYLNKIFKIANDLGENNMGQHGYYLSTPNGNIPFEMSQFRALKKKSDLKTAKVKVLSLKDEVEWLNKVKENFEDAGQPHQDLDRPSSGRYAGISFAPPPRGGGGLMRTTPLRVFDEATPQQRQIGNDDAEFIRELNEAATEQVPEMDAEDDLDSEGIDDPQED